MELIPPPGGDQNRGPELLAITWTFTALALIVVIVKIYTRFKIVHETGLDDFLIFVSTVRSYAVYESVIGLLMDFAFLSSSS